MEMEMRENEIESWFGVEWKCVDVISEKFSDGGKSSNTQIKGEVELEFLESQNVIAF